MARIGGGELGIPAIHAIAGVDLCLAQRLPARVAVPAVPTGEAEPRDGDPIALGDLLAGVGPERLDDPHALVTRNQRQRRLDRPIAVRGVNVRVAEPAGLDSNEDLAVTRLRPGDVLDAQRLGEVTNDGGLHSDFSRGG